LNEEDGETTETTGDKKGDEDLASPMSGRDSDQFASYEVPETGLEVEIQTALMSSPMRSANAGANETTDEAVVTASGESLAEESLTVDALPTPTVPADGNSDTPLDAMLADLESGQKANNVAGHKPGEPTATNVSSDGEVKKQNDLVIANQLDALAADLSVLKQES
jgi:hypothetical protein